jgi:hypothetical protein
MKERKIKVRGIRVATICFFMIQNTRMKTKKYVSIGGA